MTNQYALGYKAGLEAAVKVCRKVKHGEMPGGFGTWDEGFYFGAQTAEEQIAALPVPTDSGGIEVGSGGKHRYTGSFGD